MVAWETTLGKHGPGSELSVGCNVGCNELEMVVSCPRGESRTSNYTNKPNQDGSHLLLSVQGYLLYQILLLRANNENLLAFKIPQRFEESLI